MSTDIILANIAVRKSVEAIIELINETDECYPLATDKAWKRIVEAIPQKYFPTSPRISPMTESEAVQFELSKFPYGKFQGIQIKNIPLDYLFWLDEQDFYRSMLRRYLLSDRVQREQKDDE